MISHYIYDISDIIDVIGVWSRVFQVTGWQVMWYHMISHDISDIIDVIWCVSNRDVMWYHMISHYISAIIWYHMTIMLPRKSVLKPPLHQWYHWYHRCNMISYDITWYHMISSYSYSCYSCNTDSLPCLSYDIIWYHIPFVIAVIS